MYSRERLRNTAIARKDGQYGGSRCARGHASKVQIHDEVIVLEAPHYGICRNSAGELTSEQWNTASGCCFGSSLLGRGEALRILLNSSNIPTACRRPTRVEGKAERPLLQSLSIETLSQYTITLASCMVRNMKTNIGVWRRTPSPVRPCRRHKQSGHGERSTSQP